MNPPIMSCARCRMHPRKQNKNWCEFCIKTYEMGLARGERRSIGKAENEGYGDINSGAYNYMDSATTKESPKPSIDPLAVARSALETILQDTPDTWSLAEDYHRHLAKEALEVIDGIHSPVAK